MRNLVQLILGQGVNAAAARHPRRLGSIAGSTAPQVRAQETGPRLAPQHDPSGMATSQMTPEHQAALKAIDGAHALDPRRVDRGDGQNQETPYELHYARRSSHFLEQLKPDASPTLQLAVRAQHFRRWEVPRDSYSMDRPGYHRWRTALKQRQAEQVTNLCRECGCTPEEAERVGALIRKENLRSDEETQTLEDVACLVFLDDQFEDFEKTLNEEKMVGILRKTWAKMSDAGHALALQLSMSDRASSLVSKAITD
ncbi:MAG: hypothetical protein M1823_001637 [Watsoniomyces obsoletus]|nr:MAG: hypothetical protein M1823_001637 [Watsoniomyces obsoletus]